MRSFQVFAILLLLTFYSCNEASKINFMSVTKKVMKTEVDSLGIVIDTVLLSEYKYDRNKIKRYEKTYSFYGNSKFITTSYFTETGDIFLRESKLEGSSGFTKYEVTRNEEGRVINANQIDATNPGRVDTVKMTFKEGYVFGKLETLRIFYNDTLDTCSMSETIYNDDGQKASALTLLDCDTLTYDTWSYTDDLIKSNHISYIGDSIETIAYYGNGKVLREKVIDLKGLKLVKEKNHIFSGDNIMSSTVVDLKTGKTRFYKYN